MCRPVWWCVKCPGRVQWPDSGPCSRLSVSPVWPLEGQSLEMSGSARAVGCHFIFGRARSYRVTETITTMQPGISRWGGIKKWKSSRAFRGIGYTEVQVFFVLENTNSVTWLVHCPGKNILNIKQREGGDPGLDWDQGRGLNSSGHTRLSLSEDNAGRGSRAPWHAVWLLPRHLPPKNKEQKKKTLMN